MKKILSALLLIATVFAFVSCGNYSKKSEGVMTYEEYMAAPLDSAVVVEVFVQDTQDWWNDKISVYAADPDGGYYIYEMACTEADSSQLTPGTKIKVSGVKANWGGEVEIVDAKFDFIGNDGYVAKPKNVTNKIGTEELVNYQNQLVSFKGLEVVSVAFKNGIPGDDIYVTLKSGDVEVNFCVEYYLTNDTTEVYKTVSALAAGDKVDLEAFLFWYGDAPNPHITKIEKK